jgi:hypothetical protein
MTCGIAGMWSDSIALKTGPGTPLTGPFRPNFTDIPITTRSVIVYGANKSFGFKRKNLFASHDTFAAHVRVSRAQAPGRRWPSLGR